MTPEHPWRGRRVFITGTTGFKGAWLALWLHRLGAELRGYALAPEGDDALFRTARVDEICPTQIADIRDADALASTVRGFAPDTVFHLAAQPLVRRGYAQPLETFSSNVQGTCNLLEAARRAPGVRAVVVVTTDKCYRNREWEWGYRETDELGGDDPYSASKAAAEIATASWRRSYYAAAGIGLASARAGNVVGGGDFAEDRLVPDIVRAHRAREEIRLRYPEATRPWQHVLDCLRGYLLLADLLHRDPVAGARAWNFGPEPRAEASVREVIALMDPHLPVSVALAGGERPHEAGRLVLDSTLANKRLGWHTQLNLQATVEWTARWYAEYLQGKSARDLVLAQIAAYESLARGARP